MDEIVLSIIVVAVFLLVIVVLLVLTTRRVNVLAKKNFVDKLQEYDFLIDDKEKKVEELNKTISEQRAEFDRLEKMRAAKEEEFNKKQEEHEVVLPRHASLTDGGNVLADYRAIRDEFDFNVEKIVNKFIKDHPVKVENVQKYQQFVRLRVYFGFKTIYKLSTYKPNEQIAIIKKLLRGDEWEIFESLIGKNKKINLNEIVQKMDRYIMKYDPKIYVYVPEKGRDYGYLGENVVTKSDKKITEGFKIIYGGVVFDYSI